MPAKRDPIWLIGPNGRRNLLALVGLSTYVTGALDALSDILPGATPATLFFWGTTLMTTSVLKRRSRR